MELHYSRYNHIVACPDGDGYALVNFRTGAFAHLDELTKSIFDQAPELGDSVPVVAKLKRKGFLVEFDELKYMKAQTYMLAGASPILTLVICPTMECNFACPYCFQMSREGHMSDEIAEQTVAFAARILEKKAFKRFCVVWFGGEPLLCPDVIRDLSGRFRALADEHGIAYYANIVTNGWFFTQENADMLCEAGCEQVQITLDGPDAASHDLTRKLRGGGGSFERILKNLETVRTPMEIHIRCNIQKDNSALYGQLDQKIRELAERTGNHLTAYPAHMDNCGISAPDPDFVNGHELQVRDFADDNGEFLLSNMDARYRITNCMMHDAFAFSIDEKGYLYHCGETIGQKDAIYGHVSDFDLYAEPSVNPEGTIRYIDGLWPEEDEECMACKVYPFCRGGCPITRLSEGRRCLPIRWLMDEYAIEKCSKIKKRQES